LRARRAQDGAGTGLFGPRALRRRRPSRAVPSEQERESRLAGTSLRSPAVDEPFEDTESRVPFPNAARGASLPPLRRFVIRGKGRIVIVPVDEVVWIEAERNYLRLHLVDRAHLYRGSIGAVAARLDPARFARIHRSAIVNLDRVREMRTTGEGACVVRLDSGATVRMSRTQRGELAALLESSEPALSAVQPSESRPAGIQLAGAGSPSATRRPERAAGRW